MPSYKEDCYIYEVVLLSCILVPGPAGLEQSTGSSTISLVVIINFDGPTTPDLYAMRNYGSWPFAGARLPVADEKRSSKTCVRAWLGFNTKRWGAAQKAPPLGSPAAISRPGRNYRLDVSCC